MPSILFGKFLLFFGAICIAGTILLVPNFFAQAAWDGHYYDAGETLNPECTPTDVECDVNPVTDAAHGGTGLTSYSAGDLLYANSASTFGKLALGVDGKVLKVVAGVLAWADDTVGTAFTADGNGIELSGPTFSLELDGASLAKSADGLRLSATYAGQNTISTVGTITAGVWNGTAIADAFLTKSGDWTGTFDGLEGIAYTVLGGRAGGQTLNGGTGSGENLTLQSTANATKGKILFGASSAYDEDTLRLGIGTASPVSSLQVASAVPATANNGLVSLGSGPFDGATSGFFTGSAAGTALAINTASGYAGDLINVQIAGSTRLNQAANGRMTITGTVGGTGVLYLANPSGGFAFGVDSSGGFAQSQTASKGMAFYNNAGTTYLKVGGSGGITGASDTLSGSDATSLLSLSQSWNTSGTPTALKLNISNTASNASSLLMDLQLDSVSQFKVTKAGAATFVGSVTSGGLASNSMSANNTGIVMKLRGGASTAAITGVSIDPLASSTITSGNHNTLDISANSIFAPTSGSGTFSAFAISSEINQTGSASGISRGLYINPTMTAAADFRALEISNNSQTAIYQSGVNAKNYFAGKVGIGVITPTETFQITDSRTTPNSTGMYLQKNGAVAAGVSYGLNVDTSAASLTNVGAYISARGATNNRAIWVPSNNTAGTTNYGLYIEGAAQNYFAGNVGVGTITPTNKFDVTGGSLSSTQRAISATGTLSSTAARQAGIQGAFTTSAGNTNENDGLFIQLLPGNVSSAFNIAGMFANTVAGVGTSVIGATANYGVYGDVNATTVGTNIGSYGQSAGGNISIGASGNSIAAKDSAVNIGVLGLGRNSGVSGIQLGGYFGLSSSAPSFTSAALMADNGATTSPILVARDNGSEVFRIDDGGKVGIGIVPTQSLETTGSIIGGQGFSMGKGLTNTSLGFGFGRNFSTGGIFDSGRYSFQFTRPGNGDRLDLEIYDGAGTLVTRNTTASDGGVGIGTITPSNYRLKVMGTRQAASGDLAVVDFENAGTSSADVLTLKQTGEAGSAESQFITFYTNAGLIGSIASNGSGVTSYNTTSDRRLKDNIEDTEYGIDDVLKIPVREYTMRQDPKALKQTGFIAQELAAIYPDAVSASGDDGISPLNGKTPWSIDYGRLTPLLVKSIQDQQGLLGEIADKDALDVALSDVNNEQNLSAWEYISQKIQEDWRPLLNFAALRVTAIRGYFDEIFAKKTHTEQLCVGVPGNETCLTKPQLDALLSGQSSAPAASQSSVNAEDGETPGGQNGNEAEPPAIEPSPPVEEIVP